MVAEQTIPTGPTGSGVVGPPPEPGPLPEAGSPELDSPEPLAESPLAGAVGEPMDAITPDLPLDEPAVPAEAALPVVPPGEEAGAVGTGQAFGTFGELLQGALPPDGRDFLVTLPVARYSAAIFQSRPGKPLRVFPSGKSKVRRLAASMLSEYGLDPGASVSITSGLPPGKGMASSTADLVATARAIGQAFGFAPSPATIEDLLRGIEPSDGVMYNSAVAFYQREVRLMSTLGALPPLTVVGMDEGGAVDTVAFNQVPKPYTDEDHTEYQHLLDQAAYAIAAGDANVIGGVATRSALMNQRLRPKRLLPAALQLCRDIGAAGLVAAHSGTMIGILLDERDRKYHAKLAATLAGCRRLTSAVEIHHTVPFTDQQRWRSAARRVADRLLGAEDLRPARQAWMVSGGSSLAVARSVPPTEADNYAV